MVSEAFRDARIKSLRYGELDRSIVVAAAVRVAERSGVRSVTVRSLATELGLSTTAMYRYVDGKAELLNLVAEATLASVELPVSGSWQQRIRVFARSARTAMLRIDGIADLLQTQPAKGAALQVDTLIQQLVVDAGVPASRRESARLLLMIFVTGSVSFEQALDGLPHGLDVAPETRFEQGLDVLIAGLEAM
ncbi:TetR/AcrR family transcriptional regulator C-terminal domain-containing protein [Mycolicibacterium hodleri]|uniref:TetR family transcriptional regulator n=1 Tax=Mycolicibacterium hodleri TaxID=49897 RepID=A0A502EHQ3_9MYCO|nr:TetR/AcrR family transcriptional regulator C-terminal domain-containing protein [Mycolicibacterium hodleri]TPG36674.1 TetR family transcriptional regulator [Mycolicibacterium hodleri]